MDYDPPHAWRYEAKCAGEDTNTWYPPRDKALYRPIATTAKNICYGKDGRPECPVRKECLWEAIKTDEPHGIWGGMSHRERAAFVRKYKKQSSKMTLKEFVMKGGPS